MILPEQKEQNFEGQSFLILINRSPILSTICIIIEIKMGVSGMPLQLELDYRFRRSIKEPLKRQCFKLYTYFTSSSQYYPHTFVSATGFLFCPNFFAFEKAVQKNKPRLMEWELLIVPNETVTCHSSSIFKSKLCWVISKMQFLLVLFVLWMLLPK